MISFLTSAKPFKGPSRDIQLRAIRSWIGVAAGVEVFLYGETEGAEEICDSLGTVYVPDVETSPSGIPLFNAIAKHAQKHANYEVQCYVNCDILLNSTLGSAARSLFFEDFLMVGQRIDLAEGEIIDVNKPYWLNKLKISVEEGKADLHRPSGKDYFVFTRGLWKDLAELVIGRAGYDDALLAYCLRKKIPIIDATFDVAALHQGHDYSHVPGKRKEVWRGPDVRLNERNHPGITHSAPEVSDADWSLIGHQLKRTCARGDKLRQIELQLRFAKNKNLSAYVVRGLWRVLRDLRLYSPPLVTLAQVLDSYSRVSVEI